MIVIVVRIDDRLIHGQVVEGWLKPLRIDRVIVANDLAADDDMQKMLMRLAIPEHIALSVLHLGETADAWKADKWPQERTMILVSSPSDLLELIEKGMTVRQANVGGINYSRGKVQVHETVSLDARDISAFEELDRRGVVLELRILPDDERIKIN